jgi:hypothetical protein
VSSSSFSFEINEKPLCVDSESEGADIFLRAIVMDLLKPQRVVAIVNGEEAGACLDLACC